MPVHQFNVGDVLAAADVNAWLAPIAGVKSADQIITSHTTLINDADMRFAVAANSLYEFHVFTRYASPIAADFKSSMTVPAGASAHFMRVGQNASNQWVGPTDVLDTDTITSYGAGAGTAQVFNFFGWLDTASTAGTLIFQWAQNTTSAGNTTLFANSYLTGRRIG